MRIEKLSAGDESAWDNYVAQHLETTFAHYSGWKKVVERSMGYEGTYLMALDNGRIVGVCPLFILSTGLFGTIGISVPFLDYGGILADNIQVEKLLVDKAEIIGGNDGCRYVELRQRSPLQCDLPISSRKITVLVSLQGGPEAVFGRLRQNVRNKIRKARKSGVTVDCGIQYLSDFYRVYARNLRDLGTPVITKKFFETIADILPKQIRIYRATRQGKTIGAKVIFVDQKTCYFIWAAAIRENLCYSPVHALNWKAIEDACMAGCLHVDMGRSTENSTHHDFKKYWGMETKMLPYAYQLLNCNEIPGLNPDNPKFSLAIEMWKKMPMFLTRWLGPPLARRLP